ncbi:MAG: cyclic nucleotide-binding domain-containing protein [Deltaproteobacteria bacterium]|nr:MAG: cyclic nucleotide-binding domain-containing protein [Deltaproteobacteria bacterium]
MSFLDDFTDQQRALFLSKAEVIDLHKGAQLLRRGEPGGDLFWIEEGSLEVVDRRPTPELILAVLKAGHVVGEMSFVDDAPRSADVRAAERCRVHHWTREDLHALIEREPHLGVSIYRSIATTAIRRTREATNTVVATGFAKAASTGGASSVRATEDARRLADEVKRRLRAAETKLRADAADAAAKTDVRQTMEDLRTEVNALFVAHATPEASDEAAAVLAGELHPYLVRSSLADRCIRRHQGVAGTADILSHVLVGRPSGDGQLGELLDDWLLDLPTVTALRTLRDPTVNGVLAQLPAHRNRRVLLLNAGTGSLVTHLAAHLGERPTVLTIVDQSRDALAFHDAAVEDIASGVIIQTTQERFVAFAEGRTRHSFPRQDVVIIHGLLEYLPDRMVVSLLQAAGKTLAPGGVVVLSALDEADDSLFLDRVLSWPTIRRSPEAIGRLIHAAGMTWEPDASPEGAEAPGVLVVGRRPEAVQPKTSRRERLAARRAAL